MAIWDHQAERLRGERQTGDWVEGSWIHFTLGPTHVEAATL